MARDILLRITGDPAQGKAAIDAIVAKVRELASQRATVDVDVASARANAKLDEIAAKLRALPDEKIIQVRVQAEQQGLDRQLAERELVGNRLAGGGQPGVQGGSIQELEGQLARLDREIEIRRARISLLQGGEVSPRARALLAQGGAFGDRAESLGGDLASDLNAETGRNLSPFEKAMQSVRAEAVSQATKPTREQAAARAERVRTLLGQAGTYGEQTAGAAELPPEMRGGDFAPGARAPRGGSVFEHAAGAASDDAQRFEQEWHRTLTDLHVEASRTLSPFEKARLSAEPFAAEWKKAGSDVGNIFQRVGQGIAQVFGRDITKNLSNGVDAIDNGFKKALVDAHDLAQRLQFFGPILGAPLALISKFGDLIEKVAGSIPGVSSSFAGLIGSIAGIATVIPLVAILAGLLATIVLTVLQAVAGFVFLGIAALAVLGPIAAVLGAIFFGLVKVISGQQQLTQATQALQAATLALSQAQTAVHQARMAALEDEKQATLGLVDAQNAYKDALLAVQSAKLAQQQAQLAKQQFAQYLQGVGTSPAALTSKAANVDVAGLAGQQQVGASALGFDSLILEWKSVVLATKTSAQGVADASAHVNDSADQLVQAEQKVAGYLHDGLQYYQPLTTALNNLATAEQNAKTARSNYVTAGGPLSTQQKELLGLWTKLKAAVSAVLGPAVTAAFPGIAKSLGIISGGLKPLEPAFKKLGGAIGEAFVMFAKWLTDPKTIKLLKPLILDAAKAVPVFTKFWLNLFTLLLQIADDAMPLLIQGTQDLGTWFQDVSKHPQKIKEFIDKCIDSTKTFIKDVIAVADWFLKALNWLKQFTPHLSTIKGILGGFAAAVTPFWTILKDIAKLIGAPGVGILAGLVLISKLMGGLGGGSLIGAGAKFLGGGLKTILGGGAATAAEVEGGATLGAADVAAPAVLAFGGGYALGTVLNNALGISGGIDDFLGLTNDETGEAEKISAKASSDQIKEIVALMAQIKSPKTSKSTKARAVQTIGGLLATTAQDAQSAMTPGDDTYAPQVAAIDVAAYTAIVNTLLKAGIKIPGATLATATALMHELPKHAAGGVAGIFGEAGPEALIPLEGRGAEIVAQAIGRYLTAGMVRPAGVAGSMAPASGSQIHHHDWHLNQGDTINDDQHFIKVVERELASTGNYGTV